MIYTYVKRIYYCTTTMNMRATCFRVHITYRIQKRRDVNSVKLPPFITQSDTMVMLKLSDQGL
uniref:Uncharacterized protein n=1 Tax=Anguilla anguilla TaxID=7936 RepID=A0A0E9XG96_ANGAN